MENATAEIGHNNPPIDKFEIATEKIESLFNEAEHWLDGTEIKSQAIADGVTQLLVLARDAAKEIDDLRVIEKKPHDAAAKEVQEKYMPLLRRADIITSTCKPLLGAWLAKINEELREKERAARIDADQKAKIAYEAIMSVSIYNIKDRENAEILLDEAKRAAIGAASAANATAKLKIDGHRAVSIRTSYRAELHDKVIAVWHLWRKYPDEFDELLLKLAQKELNAGKRQIDGFNIIKIESAA